MKDWIGNSRSAHATIGARNYASHERQEYDYYATEPKAVELLMEVERFSPTVWECACGEGHLSKVLEKGGYNVISTDLIDRSYGQQHDFLNDDYSKMGGWDIITNPPYRFAREFVEKALEAVRPGGKVAMFLKLTFLETQGRRKLFDENPPKVVYVSSKRLHCAINGYFDKYSKSNAMAFAWFVWVKGFKDNPLIKWIN